MLTASPTAPRAAPREAGGRHVVGDRTRAATVPATGSTAALYARRAGSVWRKGRSSSSHHSRGGNADRCVAFRKCIACQGVYAAPRLLGWALIICWRCSISTPCSQRVGGDVEPAEACCPTEGCLLESPPWLNAQRHPACYLQPSPTSAPALHTCCALAGTAYDTLVPLWVACLPAGDPHHAVESLLGMRLFLGGLSHAGHRAWRQTLDEEV